MPEIFDMNRNDRSANEKAILVGLLQSDKTYPEDPLEELSGLADAAGIQVLGELTQRRDRPTAATYLGKGKIEELSAFIETVEADLVIFDNDLAPAQTRNLEKSLDIKVIDHFILEIHVGVESLIRMIDKPGNACTFVMGNGCGPERSSFTIQEFEGGLF